MWRYAETLNLEAQSYLKPSKEVILNTGFITGLLRVLALALFISGFQVNPQP